MSAEKTTLPPGWAEAAIEDIFAPLEDGRTLHQGWSPQCEKAPSPSDDVWGVLKTTAIQAGAFLPEHNKCLPKGLAPRPLIEVKAGDILVTCAGPRVRCGVTCLVKTTRPRLMMSGKMYRFRPVPQMEPRFVEAYLQTHWATSAIDKLKTGGSDSGLNLTHDRFRPLSIRIAPLNEQRRIVDILDELFSDLDAGVAALERVQKKLKLYRAAVLKAAVEGALTAAWRKKNRKVEPATKLLARILAERRRRWEADQLKKYKDAGREPPTDWKAKYQEPAGPDTAKLPPLPDGWCWVTIEQLNTSTMNGYGNRSRTDGEPHIVLRLADITNGEISYSNVRRITCTQDEVTKYALLPNDILLIRVNGSADLVGRLVLVRDVREEVLFCDHFIRARTVLPNLAVWIRIYGDTHRFRNYIESKKVSSAGQNTINQGAFVSFIIPLPSLAEQEVIKEIVEDQISVIDHLNADIEAKLKSAASLRQSILRHAFSGHLVPQNPKDEPASELLKRIAAERAERERAALAAKLAQRKAKASPPVGRSKARKKTTSRVPSLGKGNRK